MTDSESKNTSSWHVYIVSCADKTLYTGITKNIKRRIIEHNSSRKGAKYTRSRQPVTLVYSEPHEDRSSAAKREYCIKKMTLSAKKHLIAISEYNITT